MRCYRLWWKLAKRRDIVNFWHRHEQWTTIHARRRPNSLKLHTSAVHVSKAYSFIMHIVLLILMHTHTHANFHVEIGIFFFHSDFLLLPSFNCMESKLVGVFFCIFVSFFWFGILSVKICSNIFYLRPTKMCFLFYSDLFYSVFFSLVFFLLDFSLNDFDRLFA